MDILEDLRQLALKSEIVGMHEDIPNEVYHHKDCPGLSSSQIKNIQKGYNHFIHSQNAPEKETPAKLFGSAVHDSILLPGHFEQQYIVAPIVNKRTNAGKEEWKEFLEVNKGKSILTQDQYDECEKIREIAHSHPTVREILDTTKKEVTFFWYDNDYSEDDNAEVLCKCKADLIDIPGRVVFDIKTCPNSTHAEFIKSITKFEYDISTAYYLDGISSALKSNFETFIYIAIENVAPYDINLFYLEEKSINKGREFYKNALMKYKSWEPYFKTKANYIYNEMIESIGTPPWRKLKG